MSRFARHRSDLLDLVPAQSQRDEGIAIASVSPSIGPMTGGTKVTITGAAFRPGMVVQFMSRALDEVADAPDVAVLSSGVITCKLPPFPAAVPVSVRVFYSDWSDGTEASDAFVYARIASQ